MKAALLVHQSRPQVPSREEAEEEGEGQGEEEEEEGGGGRRTAGRN